MEEPSPSKSVRATDGAEDQPLTPFIPAPRPATRHDGWTGERMATFCETLAENVRACPCRGQGSAGHVVAEACDAARMGISGAYAARRRNPVFACARVGSLHSLRFEHNRFVTAKIGEDWRPSA